MVSGLKRRNGASEALLLLAAGCTTQVAPQPAPPPPPVPTYSKIGLESVIGHNARALESAFGRPDLDIQEGTARKLQFASGICVLDLYLYPPTPGGDPVVTYLDARLPDGRDFDRASCVAALQKREETR
jgi:hypothetical protein